MAPIWRARDVLKNSRTPGGYEKREMIRTKHGAVCFSGIRPHVAKDS